MKKVLITGAAGFLGRRLLRSLAAVGSLAGKQGEDVPIGRVCLADIVPAEPPPNLPFACKPLVGDLADPDYVDRLAAWGPDTVFHLASSLTLQAERDPDAAYRVNVEALRQLIGTLRHRPRLVFTSSIAVFGGTLPDAVGDGHQQAPTTTYGTHKALNELLILDGSRHGKIDGRSLRLPIVVTRPGTAQPSVSDKIAAIIREPLNGIDTVVPLRPETPVPLVSAGTAATALIRTHDVAEAKLPDKRAFNLPALTIQAQDVAETVRRCGATGKIRFKPDKDMQRIVEGWPAHFVSQAAVRLGVRSDSDVYALVADYLENRDV
ncbi:MAG: NAD-dependent epimerase/dehydratase family protein [Pseudomonadota bacterium]|nr:NAD-dependent epimerase/dehydratase family protein [Pseudomonadota bacterium]